ncbi:ATP phosphoribosyltransferase regulatory subunit [Heyndrickxia camelliae]|nr:ATP phosphoribosyltransferase regulatory subunit [Heyndrickxia camelliae]
MMFLPSGSQDEFGNVVSNRNMVCEVFRDIIANRGFVEISTPLVEYASTFTNRYVGMELQNLLKWFNRNGEIEVLRPDWTSAIARALVRLKSKQKKWAYQGSVFREDQPGIEKRQIGIEIIQTPEILGESECLFLAKELLEKLNINEYAVELGHTDIFEELTKSLKLPAAEKQRLRVAMHNKRKDEVFAIVTQYGDENLATELVFLIGAYGSIDILKEYEHRWAENAKLSAILQHLNRIITILKEVNIHEIMVDLGRVKNLPYYSGIMFRGYSSDNGDLCFSGGRYDKLYDQFETNMSAIGLAFDVDILANKMGIASKRERIGIVATDDTLAFAERYRSKCKESIVEIVYEVDPSVPYDKVLLVKKMNGNFEVVEA